jgi:hypothetical protein
MTSSHRRWHLCAWLFLAPVVAAILAISLALRTEALP